MSKAPKGLIKYTSRDYETIMEEFFDLVPKLTDLWKPEADADPGVVLGKILASAADMLGVNIDWLANEVYGPSVSQRKNAEKVFALAGYTLGWYTCARTEVTFTAAADCTLNFGFNGANFSTLNAFTDITQEPRVITYNVLPLTNKFGTKDTRSRRRIVTEHINLFTDTDEVKLQAGESVTRVAIEGELRSFSVNVETIKKNNYIINLPSQHVDTTAVWVKAKASQSEQAFLSTQWVQVASASEFTTPEPRFAVTYDNYSNARVQISNYLNQLEDYENNWLTVYWFDSSGVIGCVGTDVLSTFLPARPEANNYDEDMLSISNLSNTVELPHTNAVTGSSPETAKQAYFTSRNYINTHDSLITLPDYNRFLKREPGVDCAVVIDCQKALEINLAIYHDENLTIDQKSKMYITNNDFPADDEAIYDWKNILELGFDPTDPARHVFAANFKTYTAMCFCIHNDFKNSEYGQGRVSNAQIQQSTKFHQYKPPALFLQGIEDDHRPLGAMSVELQFGWARIFPFYVTGTITPINPVSKDVAANIVAKVKEDLAMHFAPVNREFGQQPTLIEIIEVVENADTRIRHFDPGSYTVNNKYTPGIIWNGVDINYFSPISFARYVDPGESSLNIRIAPDFLLR